MNARREIALGKAAEHLVCSDLLIAGYTAFLTDQICAYDIVVELPTKLVRIQVKATSHPIRLPQRAKPIMGYHWTVVRGSQGRVRPYTNEFDVLALVALDIKAIAYLPIAQIKQAFTFRVDGKRDAGPHSSNLPGRTFTDYPHSLVLA
jgi:hypothetical protein